MKGFELATLPPAVQEKLLESHRLQNVAHYRRARVASRELSGEAGGLFGMLASAPVAKVAAQVKTESVYWATDNYSEQGRKPKAAIIPEDFSLIVPRVEKAKEAQRQRTKEKAEVFTPSWLCNAQNSLIDDAVLYPGAFNSVDVPGKTWTVNPEPIRFTEEYTWAHYVAERRIEFAMGEAPYLASRYDTTTGEYLPVRDGRGHFQRIGLLDRKLRVVAENAGKDLWVTAALTALRTTYGYEWQGDNLLLARLNFLNTFVDYHKDFLGSVPGEECLLEVAEIASWNLFQMDGLKMVAPMTCSAACAACAKKSRTGHDGRVALVRFGKTVKPFEDMVDR